MARIGWNWSDIVNNNFPSRTSLSAKNRYSILQHRQEAAAAAAAQLVAAPAGPAPRSIPAASVSRPDENVDTPSFLATDDWLAGDMLPREAATSRLAGHETGWAMWSANTSSSLGGQGGKGGKGSSLRRLSTAAYTPSPSPSTVSMDSFPSYDHLGDLGDLGDLDDLVVPDFGTGQPICAGGEIEGEMAGTWGNIVVLHTNFLIPAFAP